MTVALPVLLALYANLFSARSTNATIAGRYSRDYVAALAAGAIVCAIAGVAALRRSGAWRAKLRSHPRAVVVAALLPWVIPAFAIGAAGQLWWFQRPWQLRLFVTYALALWTLACLTTVSRASSSGAARVLWIAGTVAIAAALQGLSLATWSFSLAMSALALVAGSGLWLTASRGRDNRQLRAAVVTGAMVMALLLGEVAFRALGVGADASSLLDPALARRLHHNPAPGSVVVNQPHRLDEFPPVLVQVNSAGIRGPEPPDRADVLLIGDSFIQAVQVPWERTVGPRLEAILRRRRAGTHVVSHGVLGWSPLLEWNWYLKDGRRFGARTVVLFFFWNDLWIQGDEVQTHHAVMGADGRPAYFDVETGSAHLWHRYLRITQVAERIARNAGNLRLRRTFGSVSAQAGGGPLDDQTARRTALEMVGRDTLLSREQVRQLLTEPADRLPNDLRRLVETTFWPVMRPVRIWSPEQVRAARRSAGVLARFADDVRADGGRFIVVHVPNPMQVGVTECSVGRYFDRIADDVVLPAESGLQEWLREIGRQNNFEVYDPLLPMRERVRLTPAAPPLYLRYDCHWSEAGHAFVADRLASRLAGDQASLPSR